MGDDIGPGSRVESAVLIVDHNRLKPWIFLGEAALWVLVAVVDIVLSSRRVGTAAGALAVAVFSAWASRAWSRPYARISAEALAIHDLGPLGRFRVLDWAAIDSWSRPRPHVIDLHGSAGNRIRLRLVDVAPDQRPSLIAAIEQHVGPQTSDV